MVECEWFPYMMLADTDLVLIDTWWNVNIGISSTDKAVIVVLIDTWWNVN